MGCFTPTLRPNMYGLSLLFQFKFLSLPVERDDFSNIHPANSIWDPPNKLCSSASLTGINYKKSAPWAGTGSDLLDMNLDSLSACKCTGQVKVEEETTSSLGDHCSSSLLSPVQITLGKPKRWSSKNRKWGGFTMIPRCSLHGRILLPFQAFGLVSCVSREPDGSFGG